MTVKLTQGDVVDIIAPASRTTDSSLRLLVEMLESWGLVCQIAEPIFGEDLLCANSDALRFQHLERALTNPESKAVICARGGYGSARLMSQLMQIKKPSINKWFLGMSDVTVINNFLQKHWGWSVIHGSLAPDRFSPESVAAGKAILFGDVQQVEFKLEPMNAEANIDFHIEAICTGGNLCILQSCIGTAWEIPYRDKILLLEEVDERGYRVDRMLQHLQHAGSLQGVRAIIIGDFTKGLEPDGSSLIEPVLQRFADNIALPVLRVRGIGHDPINFPIPLGTAAQLTGGKLAKLVCETTTSTTRVFSNTL